MAKLITLVDGQQCPWCGQGKLSRVDNRGVHGLYCGICGNLEENAIATWECTNELRWLEVTTKGQEFVNSVDGKVDYCAPDKTTKTLQQAWISSTGEVEWRDVPVVKEDR